MHAYQSAVVNVPIAFTHHHTAVRMSVHRMLAYSYVCSYNTANMIINA